MPLGLGALEEKPKLRSPDGYRVAVLELIALHADRVHVHAVLAAAVVDDDLAVLVPYPRVLAADRVGHDPDRAGGPAAEFDFLGQDCTLQAVERRLLQAALAHTCGNISEAARMLGLTRGSLRHRLEKLQVHVPAEL